MPKKNGPESTGSMEVRVKMGATTFWTAYDYEGASSVDVGEEFSISIPLSREKFEKMINVIREKASKEGTAGTVQSFAFFFRL